MTFDHKKYPIIIGSFYENDNNEVGVLEAVELFTDRGEAEIIINMENKGRFYKLDYTTFVSYWRIYKAKKLKWPKASQRNKPQTIKTKNPKTYQGLLEKL